MSRFAIRSVLILMLFQAVSCKEATPPGPPPRTSSEFFLAVVAKDGERSAGTLFDRAEFETWRRAKRDDGIEWTPAGFAWFPRRPERGVEEPAESHAKRVREFERRLREAPEKVEGEWLLIDEFLLDERGAGGFTERDIDSARSSYDDMGRPAVMLEVSEPARLFLLDYARRNRGRRIAGVWDGEILFMAYIEGDLRDSIKIHSRAGYTEEAVAYMLSCFES